MTTPTGLPWTSLRHKLLYEIANPDRAGRIKYWNYTTHRSGYDRERKHMPKGEQQVVRWLRSKGLVDAKHATAVTPTNAGLLLLAEWEELYREEPKEAVQ